MGPYTTKGYFIGTPFRDLLFGSSRGSGSMSSHESFAMPTIQTGLLVYDWWLDTMDSDKGGIILRAAISFGVLCSIFGGR